MKKIFLLISLLMPAIAFCQTAQSPGLNLLPMDTVTKMVTYQEVVQAPGISKDELYNRAELWVTKTFSSSINGLRKDNKLGGKIIATGSANGTIKYAMATIPITENYTISITVKDGRYRYEVSDFTIKNSASKINGGTPIEEYAVDPKWKKNESEYKKIAKDMIDNTIRVSAEIISSLKLAMNVAAPASKDDF